MAVMALALAAAVVERQRSHEAAQAAQAELHALEQAQARQALRHGEAQLAEAQALAHVGSWDWEVAADRLTWSDELYRIFGLEPQSRPLDYAAFLAAVHPEDRPLVEETVRRSHATGESFAIEHRVVRPDGSVRWIHGKGQVVTGQAGPLRMFGTAQDVTERKQVERARSGFIAAAAHELRTPLTTIVGTVEILASFRSRLSEGQLDEYCGMIRTQGDRVKRLISGLLDLSQIELGLLRLELQPIELGPSVRRALLAAPPPGETAVQVEVPDGLDVLGDGMRLDQILVNLLTNAYRYGGPAVTVSAAAAAGVVRLVVSDNGPGVSPELVPLLFDPFQRGTRRRPQQSGAGEEGSGLGLAIVRGLANAQGGDVSYEVGRPQGARFVLHLRQG